MDQDGVWLSIVDYASAEGTSISTVRRAIKSNQLKYRETNGKYLIWSRNDQKKNQLSLFLENEELKKQILKYKEEISDLKMLLSVYEINKYELPPIPVDKYEN